MDLSRIRPLSHRIIIATTPIPPTSSPMFPGFAPPPPDYHPMEMPPYVLKRLVDFLEAIHDIPPAFLDRIIPRSEIPGVRALYHDLRADGLSEGEAIMTLGLMQRAPTGSPLPFFSVAEVMRRGCACLAGVNHVVVATSAGEPLTDAYRVIWCHEAVAEIPPETVAEARRVIERAERSRRTAFLSRRAC